MNQSNEDHLPEILSRLKVVKGPDQRGEYTAWCPFHPDGEGKPPHQPNLSVSERGYFCHACGASGGLIKLAEHLGIEIPRSSSPEEPLATYSYRDEDGNLLFQVCRFPGKKFLQRRPNGGPDSWTYSLQGVRRVLYRLPEIIKRTGEPVYLVEGEKDADRLDKEGLLSTTSPGGANKWREDYSVSLSGREVIILPDNDEAGRNHAEQAAASLHKTAASVKIVTLPDLPDKGDVSDWLSAGNTVEQLKALVSQASEYVPSPATEAEPEWEPPAPLYDLSPPPFPQEAFPSELRVLREFCAEVAESYQVPFDLPALLILSVGGMALAKKMKVHAGGDHYEPLNIWVAVVMDSGTRKSSVFSEMTSPICVWEKEKAEKMAAEIGWVREGHAIEEARLQRLKNDAAKIKKKISAITAIEKLISLLTRIYTLVSLLKFFFSILCSFYDIIVNFLLL